MLSPEGALGVLRMVEIIDGLKAKLVEIDTRIELLRREIGTLEDQKGAFVKGIRVYDPEFNMAPVAAARPRPTERSSASSRESLRMNDEVIRAALLRQFAKKHANSDT